MTAPADAAIAGMDGPLALPRANGELVFDAPWQGRAFGLAVALHEGGAFGWERFRTELIRAIADAPEGEEYYESWLRALSAVVLDAGFVDAAELDERVAHLTLRD